MPAFSELQLITDAPTVAPEYDSPLTKRMQLMLATLKPRTDAEALKLLRTSFPHSTLNERLGALARRRR